MKQNTITYDEVIARIEKLEANDKVYLEKCHTEKSAHPFAQAYGYLESGIELLRTRLEVENETK